ncbi:hypothetical protein J7T55_000183 [Diaporthe amygdali]|uniref:uncharacterized protein n=1 Tax=Phomopsis amygdali TaxID=1214568 RepID=UPI0022FDDE80|nr:uncharacterized protein J7T55_000183 [Diaporthe amygdali]KAJ0108218.1 hypothetical protein J7T55_000183 [Diaporthe amygdali]
MDSRHDMDGHGGIGAYRPVNKPRGGVWGGCKHSATQAYRSERRRLLSAPPRRQDFRGMAASAVLLLQACTGTRVLEAVGWRSPRHQEPATGPVAFWRHNGGYDWAAVEADGLQLALLFGVDLSTVAHALLAALFGPPNLALGLFMQGRGQVSVICGGGTNRLHLEIGQMELEAPWWWARNGATGTVGQPWGSSGSSGGSSGDSLGEARRLPL